MKGFFAKLKDFSPKLKVSEILLFLKPQNRWKEAWIKKADLRYLEAIYTCLNNLNM